MSRTCGCLKRDHWTAANERRDFADVSQLKPLSRTTAGLLTTDMSYQLHSVLVGCTAWVLDHVRLLLLNLSQHPAGNMSKMPFPLPWSRHRRRLIVCRVLASAFAVTICYLLLFTSLAVPRSVALKSDALEVLEKRTEQPLVDTSQDVRSTNGKQHTDIAEVLVAKHVLCPSKTRRLIDRLAVWNPGNLTSLLSTWERRERRASLATAMRTWSQPCDAWWD